MKIKKLRKYLPVYLMMMPALIYLFINSYMPLPGLVLAFKNIDFRKGIWESDWVGFKNFQYLFQTEEAKIITRNTLAYNFAFIVLNIIFGVMIAIFICEIKNKKAKAVYQSTILFPYLMSMVIVSYIVFALLSAESGVINNSLLKAMGREPVLWYMEPKYWPFILIVVNIWKGVGYGCLIYISTINGIDPSLFEAASLDAWILGLT